MLSIKNIVLVGALFLGKAIFCAQDRFLVQCLSPVRERARLPQLFSDVSIFEQLSPHELIKKGYPLDIFFKERVEPVSDDLMVQAWLRSLADVPAHLLDIALTSSAAKSATPVAFIKVLLSQGADPCMGSEPAVMKVCSQLGMKDGDVGLASDKIRMMLDFTCKDFTVRQRPGQEYADAVDSHMIRMSKRIDCLEELRGKFGAFGKNLPLEAHNEHCLVWKAICELIGYYQAVEMSSEHEKSPFIQFAEHCFAACRRQEEREEQI